MTLEVLKGVFREDPWATPLLALSVTVLCALLLYAVLGLCSKIGGVKSSDPCLNSRSYWTCFDVSWLQMPLIFGLMTLASTCIVAAVPLNETTCRILFLGPGMGHALLAAGLLSRIVQHSIKTHIVLQWLLFFFVILNQIVISAAYLHRSWTTTPKNLQRMTNKTTLGSYAALKTSPAYCLLTVHDQLLVMLYPALLVAVVLLFVYRTARRTPFQLKLREAIHAGLAASFAGAFAGCWLGAASVLGDAFLPSCLGYGCLATVVVVSLITLTPRGGSSETLAEAAVERIGDTLRRHQTPERGRLFPATSSGSTKSEPGPVILHDKHPNKNARSLEGFRYHQQIGRGKEKSLPNDPEIFIVPVASSSDPEVWRQVVAAPSMSDLAVQDTKAHHHRNRHHNRASYRSFQPHRRNHRKERTQHVTPSRSGYHWNGKLMRSILSASDRHLNKSVRMMQQYPDAVIERGMKQGPSYRIPKSPDDVIVDHSEDDANQWQQFNHQSRFNNERKAYNHSGWLY